MKILIVEDENKIAEIIKDYLEIDGFVCRIVNDGAEVLTNIKSFKPDLITLDLNLPNIDGIELIKSIENIPVIMVTARDTDDQEFEGLKKGAVDYVKKPFSPKVLVLRIKKLLNFESEIIVNQLVLNKESRIIKSYGKDLELTPHEYNILEYLMINKNKALSRDALLNAMNNGEEVFIYDRVIDTHIKNIRKKVGKQSCHVKTVRNFGYKLVEHED